MKSGILKINLAAIVNNWRYLRNKTTPKTCTAAVVKANAYGLGVKQVSQALWTAGARTFFVSSVDEAIEIRSMIPKTATVYYFNGYSPTHNDSIIEHDIIPMLNSPEQIYDFSLQDLRKAVGIQVDIGINRLGIKRTELLKYKKLIKNNMLSIMVGHLSSADDSYATETESQYSEFLKFSALFPAVPKSLAATGGILLGDKYHFDVTRPGIGLYGGHPFKGAEPVLSLNLPVIQIKTIKRFEGVGYNHTFKARKSMRIAVVVSGYADGLSRKLSNRGFLYYGSIKCAIVGRISMDLITVDISALPNDPVTLQIIGLSQSIDDLAKQLGTIGYEILTSLGSRYERVYHTEL